MRTALAINKEDFIFKFLDFPPTSNRKEKKNLNMAYWFLLLY